MQILVEDSISFYTNSNFPDQRYLTSDIPNTFRRCQYFSISTSSTTWSTNFKCLDKKVLYCEKNIIACAYTVRKAETDLECAYWIQQNRIIILSLAIYSALFKASIKLAFDLWLPSYFQRNRILSRCCFFITGRTFAVPNFQFP